MMIFVHISYYLYQQNNVLMMIPKELKMVIYAIAIVGLITVACAAAFLYVSDTSQKSFSITYEMNDGINAKGNPDSYSTDEIVEFKTPTKNGCIFDGWYKDSSMKYKITSTEGLSGDLTVYAKWHIKERYKIAYELNGGVNSPNNPKSYLEDSSVTLYQPTKNKHVFLGWHFKEDFSDQRVDYISRVQNSDVTLYAEWAVDKSGFTYYYNNSGTYKQSMDKSPMEIVGTTSYTFLNYTYENGYHMKCTESNTVSSDTTAGWTGERNSAAWTYIGDEIIIYEEEEIECKIYTATIDGEQWTDYIADDGITYRMIRYSVVTDQYGDTIIHMYYDYTGKTESEVHSYYKVTIYNDEGIVTKGSGEYPALSSVTLTAVPGIGYSFGGWYNTDGTMAKASSVIEIGMIAENITLYAYNAREYDRYVTGPFELEPEYNLENVIWTVYDYSGQYVYENNVLSYEFKKAGNYVITYHGQTVSEKNSSDYYGMYRVMSEGMVPRSYTWKFEGISYTMDVGIEYQDYTYYRDIQTDRCRTYHINYGKLVFDDDHTAQFVVVDDYIKGIAKWFNTKRLEKTWSDYQTASCILSFVQSIPYVTDYYSKGVNEYWKYPVETLYECCGDCEDTSFLYCAIAKAMGYHTALLIFDGHMAASVNVYGASGTAFLCTAGNMTYTYYYCETTGTGWKIGESPPGYTQNGIYYNQKYYGTTVGAVIKIYP